MHGCYYFLYLGRLFIHLNIIIQVRQHSSNFFNLSTTMLTSAFNSLLRNASIFRKYPKHQNVLFGVPPNTLP